MSLKFRRAQGQISRYILYVLRWMVLAIPGAWFLVQVQHVVENTYLAMVISQGLLGAAVYFVDKRIFKVNNWELGEVSKAVAAREALLQAIAALDGGRKENSEMGLIEVTLRTENERLKQRVRELEDFLKDVQRIVGRALEGVIQEKTDTEKRVRELEEEVKRLKHELNIEALKVRAHESLWPGIKELEEENRKLREELKQYEEGSFWLQVREGAEKLAEENRKLREALQWIARQPHDKRYGSRRCAETDWCITEYCLPCYARAILAALDGRRKPQAVTVDEDDGYCD